MKRPAPIDHDTAALGAALSAMLNTALSLDNLEPFLKNILRILTGPDGICSGAKAAITIKGVRGRPAINICPSCSKADKVRLAAGGKVSAGSGRIFSSAIWTGNARSGRLTVLIKKPAPNLRDVCAMIELAAKIIGARLTNETRDTELRREKDLSSSVKHIEELYLSFPDISIEELSRAVLDEARRLTGSLFGFAGYIDPATGRLLVPALTTDAWHSCAMKERPVVFKEFNGLWGWVLKRKKSLLTNKAATDRRASGLPRGHIKIDKFLGVPAMSGRKMLGMLALANTPGEFGPADLAAAQKLARVYAMILQRKAAEDRRREEDSRFRAIISSSKDIIYSVDLSGMITYISPRATDYGYTQEDLVGRPVTDFAHPDDREFLAKAFALAVRTGRTLPILPYRIKRKDGSYFYAEQKSGIVFNNGSPAYFTGVIRDVTEQRATEAQLKESEALMRTVFDTAGDAIFLKDMNGMYVKVNKAFADLFKLAPEELLGRSDSDLFTPELAAGAFSEDSEVVRTGKTLSFTRKRKLPAGDYYFNTVKTPMRNTWGEVIGVLGISRDISGIKKMETELALAHAAEAVSSVARPMAHDFNNALAAINGYATLIDEDLPDSSPIKNEISRIIEAVKRAAELTSRFQDFARDPKIKNPGEAGGDKGGGRQ